MGRNAPCVNVSGGRKQKSAEMSLGAADRSVRATSYCTLMVAVAALACPAIVTVSGMFPDGVLVDNRIFI